MTLDDKDARMMIDVLDAAEGCIRAAGRWALFVETMRAKGYKMSREEMTGELDRLRDALR
jgi:hypothetical protein